MTNKISDLFTKELERLYKKYDFLTKLKEINCDYSKIFEDFLGINCFNDKEILISKHSTGERLVIHKGKFELESSKHIVTNLFDEDVFLKKNFLSIGNKNGCFIIDLNILRSISINKPSFNKFLKLLSEYSIIINNYRKLIDTRDLIFGYCFLLKNGTYDKDKEKMVEQIDIKEFKKRINKHNKNYEKFLKKFKEFGFPYKLISEL